MRAFRHTALAIALATTFATSARAGTQAQPQLLADVAAVQPGKPFTLAVRLAIDPGWHLYWIEPGNGGLPTRVKFTLPDGFTVGETRFPVPVRFRQPGDLVGYGYEREFALLADVTPPADWPVGKDVPVRADVSWLACSDKVCDPGKQTVTLTLPSSSEPSPTNAEQFQAWRDELPGPNDLSHPSPMGLTPVRPGQARFNAHAATGPDAKDVQVFVAPGRAVDVADINVSPPEAGVTPFSFTGTLLRNQKPPDRVLVVVAYTDAAGNRRGEQIEFNNVARAFAGK
ncbi:MAG TPA: protein-disulfide reductase DsbD domain-containing protein [Tepidisphaeraceae bacterium]|nr:protein-disulfide reductase DsbD domain-containing protein [Tepidisphaeraceae bacterium]